MHRSLISVLLAPLFAAGGLVIACSGGDPPNELGNENVTTKKPDGGKNAKAETNTDTDAGATGDQPPPDPPPPPPPVEEEPPPEDPVCGLGNGMYCGGNGVPGKTNELYRCTDGVPALEKTCDGECIKMPDGEHDVCP